MFRASCTAQILINNPDGDSTFRITCYEDDDQCMAIKDTVKIYDIVASCDRVAALEALDLFGQDARSSGGENRGISSSSTDELSISGSSST